MCTNIYVTMHIGISAKAKDRELKERAKERRGEKSPLIASMVINFPLAMHDPLSTVALLYEERRNIIFNIMDERKMEIIYILTSPQ